jgi:general nucleoside transport system permease protein
VVTGALIFGIVDSFQIGLQSIGTAVPLQFLLMLPYILPIAIMAGMYKRSYAPASLAVPYHKGQR